MFHATLYFVKSAHSSPPHLPRVLVCAGTRPQTNRPENGKRRKRQAHRTPEKEPPSIVHMATSNGHHSRACSGTFDSRGTPLLGVFCVFTPYPLLSDTPDLLDTYEREL